MIFNDRIVAIKRAAEAMEKAACPQQKEAIHRGIILSAMASEKKQPQP